MLLVGVVEFAPGVTVTSASDGVMMGSLHRYFTLGLLLGTMLKVECPQKVILLSLEVISSGLTKMVVSFSNGQPVAVTTFTR